MPFPSDILDSGESPNIYVTSPQSSAPQTSHFPSLSSIQTSSLHSLHSISPSSSPTAPDFPSHTHTPHTLSRQHSYQHIPYDGGLHHAHSQSHHAPHHAHHHSQQHHHTLRYDSAAIATPLPPSPGPGPMDYDERVGAKRQRTTPGSSGMPGSADGGAGPGSAGGAGTLKKGSRARSDSAPLGYGLTSWPQTRPRSGSGLAPRGVAGLGGVGGNGGMGSVGGSGALNGGRREEVANIGSFSRGGQLPMLSIPSMTKQPSS